MKPVNILALLLAALLLSPSLCAQTTHRPTPEQRLFEWTDLQFSKSVYQRRRDRMIARLRQSGGGVLLVPARYGVSDGFTFRQSDDFLYLTGLELPDAVLALDADAQTAVVFSPQRDARYASSSRINDFPGRLLAADPDVSTRSGIATFRSVSELSTAVEAWATRGKTLRVNLGRRGPVPDVTSDFIAKWSVAEALIFHLQTTFAEASIANAFEDMARLRMVHGPKKIDAMRRVCALTIEAIQHAAGFVREGIDERGLEAELEAAYKRGGAQRLAFASIVKSGPNSLWPWRILAANHDRRNRIMSNGDLVIFDVGTELDYYVSDVGRTFPVSGKFTARQRRALEMATAVSDTIIAAIRPSVSFAELKDIAVAKIPPDERRYMQAGGFYGHHIGLSTGDPALADVPLEAGMIFTVEPWYYNHDEELSVFVEDVILVTEDGHENLTAALPRDPDGLEAITGH